MNMEFSPKFKRPLADYVSGCCEGGWDVIRVGFCGRGSKFETFFDDCLHVHFIEYALSEEETIPVRTHLGFALRFKREQIPLKGVVSVSSCLEYILPPGAVLDKMFQDWANATDVNLTPIIIS